MKSNKKVRIINSGSVKIFPDTHQKLVDFCKQEGIKISYFVTQAVREKLEKQSN